MYKNWKHNIPYSIGIACILLVFLFVEVQTTYSNTSNKRIESSVPNYLRTYSNDEQCIDYDNFSSPNISADYGYYRTTYENRNVQQGIFDKGYESILSRHTIHSNKNERDAHTNYGLKTIPDNANTSVRLGNWSPNYGTEAIEYKFHVNTNDFAVLQIDYALVFQEPGHPMPPMFTIQILDVFGNVLNTCADIRLSPEDTKSSDWHHVQNPFSTEPDSIWWKDWSTLGLDLSPYNGETIHIRLTTYDCGYGEHFGYAYFTMHCQKPEIEGWNCGQHPSYFKMYNGFNYRWYKQKNSRKISNILNKISSENINTYVISRNQRINISSNDTSTYCCDLMALHDTTCYFTKTVKAVPLFAHSKAHINWNPTNCQNHISFSNQSEVIGVWKNDTIHTDEPLTNYLWILEDDTFAYDNTIHRAYPNTGGSYSLKLVSTMAGGCSDTLYIQGIVPEISNTSSILNETICEGDIYELNSKQYSISGTYLDTIKNQYGCDSLITLNLTVKETELDTISSICCEGDSILFYGKYFKTGGYHTLKIKNSLGCYDYHTLYITMHEGLNVDINIPTDNICADDAQINISLRTTKGHYDSYQLIFDQKAINAGFINQRDLLPTQTNLSIPIPENVKVDNYSAEIYFIDSHCSTKIIPINFTIHYPSSVIIQRWNDVLAVKNEHHNGGYLFTNYQWYKNNLPIQGEKSSIYYAEKGLNPDASYSVELVRKDGTQISSCILIPEPFDIEDTKNKLIIINSYQGEIKIVQATKIKIFTANGVVIFTQEISENTTINLPSPSGFYAILFQNNDGSESIQKFMIP